MDCQTVLKILDCCVADLADANAASARAAEAHLAECRRCAAVVRNRRRLDRKIGRILRSVPVPQDAPQRLLARIAEIEAAVSARDRHSGATSSSQPPDMGALVKAASNSMDGRRPANLAEPAARTADGSGRGIPRKRLAGAACVVAALGLVAAVWFLRPRLTVEDISRELAQIDEQTLQNLPDFNGNSAASQIPPEPGWQKLEWCCGGKAKGLPATAAYHAVAVFGFIIPQRDYHPKFSGVLALIPRAQVRRPPSAPTFSAACTAAQSSGYNSGPIGETASVAWTSGDVVCICLVGTDSRAALQRILDEPSA